MLIPAPFATSSNSNASAVPQPIPPRLKDKKTKFAKTNPANRRRP